MGCGPTLRPGVVWVFIQQTFMSVACAKVWPCIWRPEGCRCPFPMGHTVPSPLGYEVGQDISPGLPLMNREEKQIRAWWGGLPLVCGHAVSWDILQTPTQGQARCLLWLGPRALKMCACVCTFRPVSVRLRVYPRLIRRAIKEESCLGHWTV